MQWVSRSLCSFKCFNSFKNSKRKPNKSKRTVNRNGYSTTMHREAGQEEWKLPE